MSLIHCALSPHPPLLIPPIGQASLAQVEHSRAALEQLARHIAELHPDTVVIVTPHGPVAWEALNLLAADRMEAGFRAFSWDVALRGDLDLAEEVRTRGVQAGFPVTQSKEWDSSRWHFTYGLDHATMVPLYYLHEAGLETRYVVISIAAWSHRRHFEFGRILREAIEATPARVVLLATGDLSHRLAPTAPYGYEPRGAEFDRRVVDDLTRFDCTDLLALDDDFIERIGECGLRPIATMFGAMHGERPGVSVLSYEGPFGVGYCVAELTPTASPETPPASRGDETTAPSVSHDAHREARQTCSAPGENLADPSVAECSIALVRAAIEAWISRQEAVALPPVLPAALLEPAAAFVCIKTGGQLRGCIGTIRPTCRSLAEELLQNAISAATRDPRFPPVNAQELESLEYTVDVLAAPEAIDSVKALDPRVFGVIVQSGARSGVLLPDIEGIDNAEMQVEVARRKAGIGPGETLGLQRFRVHRFQARD